MRKLTEEQLGSIEELYAKSGTSHHQGGGSSLRRQLDTRRIPACFVQHVAHSFQLLPTQEQLRTFTESFEQEGVPMDALLSFLQDEGVQYAGENGQPGKSEKGDAARPPQSSTGTSSKSTLQQQEEGVFRLFDPNGSGLATYDMLFEALTTIVQGLSAAQAHALLSRAPVVTNDGLIDYCTFFETILSTPPPKTAKKGKKNGSETGKVQPAATVVVAAKRPRELSKDQLAIIQQLYGGSSPAAATESTTKEAAAGEPTATGSSKAMGSKKTIPSSFVSHVAHSLRLLPTEAQLSEFTSQYRSGEEEGGGGVPMDALLLFLQDESIPHGQMFSSKRKGKTGTLRAFDAAETGFVTPEMLFEALTTVGHGMTAERARTLIERAPIVNKEGLIDYNAFFENALRETPSKKKQRDSKAAERAKPDDDEGGAAATRQESTGTTCTVEKQAAPGVEEPTVEEAREKQAVEEAPEEEKEKAPGEEEGKEETYSDDDEQQQEAVEAAVPVQEEEETKEAPADSAPTEENAHALKDVEEKVTPEEEIAPSRQVPKAEEEEGEEVYSDDDHAADDKKDEEEEESSKYTDDEEVAPEAPDVEEPVAAAVEEEGLREEEVGVGREQGVSSEAPMSDGDETATPAEYSEDDEEVVGAEEKVPEAESEAAAGDDYSEDEVVDDHEAEDKKPTTDATGGDGKEEEPVSDAAREEEKPDEEEEPAAKEEEEEEKEAEAESDNGSDAPAAEYNDDDAVEGTSSPNKEIEEAEEELAQEEVAEPEPDAAVGDVEKESGDGVAEYSEDEEVVEPGDDGGEAKGGDDEEVEAIAEDTEEPKEPSPVQEEAEEGEEEAGVLAEADEAVAGENQDDEHAASEQQEEELADDEKESTGAAEYSDDDREVDEGKEHPRDHEEEDVVEAPAGEEHDSPAPEEDHAECSEDEVVEPEAEHDTASEDEPAAVEDDEEVEPPQPEAKEEAEKEESTADDVHREHDEEEEMAVDVDEKHSSAASSNAHDDDADEQYSEMADEEEEGADADYHDDDDHSGGSTGSSLAEDAVEGGETLSETPAANEEEEEEMVGVSEAVAVGEGEEALSDEDGGLEPHDDGVDDVDDGEQEEYSDMDEDMSEGTGKPSAAASTESDVDGGDMAASEQALDDEDDAIHHDHDEDESQQYSEEPMDDEMEEDDHHHDGGMDSSVGEEEGFHAESDVDDDDDHHHHRGYCDDDEHDEEMIDDVAVDSDEEVGSGRGPRHKKGKATASAARKKAKSKKVVEDEYSDIEDDEEQYDEDNYEEVDGDDEHPPHRDTKKKRRAPPPPAMRDGPSYTEFHEALEVFKKAQDENVQLKAIQEEMTVMRERQEQEIEELRDTIKQMSSNMGSMNDRVASVSGDMSSVKETTQSTHQLLQTLLAQQQQQLALSQSLQQQVVSAGPASRGGGGTGGSPLILSPSTADRSQPSFHTRNDYRSRVAAMYEQYDPSKLGLVDKTMEKYAGQEDQLIAAMVKRYGPEPELHLEEDEALSDYRTRVIAMYEKYDPSKVGLVDNTMKKYTGQEDQLLAAMVKRYGPEPARPRPVPSHRGVVSSDTTPAVSAGPATPTLGGQQRQMFSPIDVTSGGGGILASPSFAVSGPGAGYQPPQAFSSSPTSRDRVTAMYSKYDPDKLPMVDKTMEKYAGKEEQLIAAMVKRYGPEPERRTSVLSLPGGGGGGGSGEGSDAENPSFTSTVGSLVLSPVPGEDENRERTDEELKGFKDRVIAMYSKYAPDKLQRVDKTMEKYAGKEEQLMAAMVNKYGPEPERQPSPVLKSASATAPQEGQVAEHVEPQEGGDSNPAEPVPMLSPPREAEGAAPAPVVAPPAAHEEPSPAPAVAQEEHRETPARQQVHDADTAGGGGGELLLSPTMSAALSPTTSLSLQPSPSGSPQPRPQEESTAPKKKEVFVSESGTWSMQTKYAHPYHITMLFASMVMILRMKVKALPPKATQEFVGSFLPDGKQSLAMLVARRDVQPPTVARHTCFKMVQYTGMKLNEASMEKMFDLMAMNVKFYLCLCTYPTELLECTLNLVDQLKPEVSGSPAHDQLEMLTKAFKFHHDKLRGLGDFVDIRHALLNVWADRRAKVSVLAARKLQTNSGDIVIPRGGTIPVVSPTAAPLGVMRSYGEGDSTKALFTTEFAHPDSKTVHASLRSLKPFDRSARLSTLGKINLFDPSSATTAEP